MDVIDTELGGVKLLEPRVFEDERGFFYESFNQARFDEIVGSPVAFVQDNHSSSVGNVLRGMHFQVSRPQGKLVRVLSGEIYDVVVDLRPESPDFGKWEGYVLSSSNRRQLWVPAGFAHGFLAAEEGAQVAYKVTEYRFPELERCLLWCDSKLDISWPMKGEPVISEKDRRGCKLDELRTLF